MEITEYIDKNISFVLIDIKNSQSVEAHFKLKPLLSWHGKYGTHPKIQCRIFLLIICYCLPRNNFKTERLSQ